MKKLYYHITLDLDHDGTFYPKLPSYMFSFEDIKTNRICVSDSLKGCLSAFPKYLNEGDYLKVFVIDTNKLGITNGEINSPEKLYSKELLNDSLITNESWITKEFTVPKEDQYFIKLSWLETSGRQVFSNSVFHTIANAYEQEIRKVCSIDDEVINFFDVSEFLEFNREVYQKFENEIDNISIVADFGMNKDRDEESREIFFEDREDILMRLKQFIVEEYSTVTIISYTEEEMLIEVPPNTDVSGIFLYHNRLTKDDFITA
ncbi:hypothetical protein AAGG74_17665 [Bacillus mexicanus]|uniref:hypothetical protein n=1 Tax=Bacillus mexicanus TaxID=2834415 RepID=UPI003D1DDC5B